MRLSVSLFRLQHALLSLVAVVAISAAPAAHAQGAGYWHTSGNLILDANNAQVRIAGINWYGLETVAAVPHGLSSQDYKAVLQTIKTQGYNTVRLPFSNQMIETPGSNLNISYYNSTGPINTDLQGLNSLQVMDKIIVAAGTLGLKIILDDHRSEAGDSAEANGLWFTSAYPESAWIADWTMLAQRYLHNSTVIGFDLRNEPHNAYSGGACWSCGGANDWHLAAQRAGNAVLAVNPQLLMFVEGTDAYNNDYYWWGGNLQGAATAPVTLNTANQLVYSAHEYGPHEYQQTWFNAGTSYASLSAVWSKHWAFLSQNNVAPVWVGEFGTTNSAGDIQDATAGSQGQWFTSLVNYLNADPSLNWTYWALNGEDSYGLLNSNYDATPASSQKQAALATIQFKLSTGVGVSYPPTAPAGLTATATSSSQVNLAWTASTTAGAYYTVYFGTSPGSIATVLASGVTSPNLLVSGLTAGTTYYFTVAAVSSGGTSGLSNVASANTQAITAPTAPVGLTATTLSATQISLAWVTSATAGATYSVWGGLSSGSATLMASGLASPNYTAAGLTASTSYSFTVTATSSAGTSPASSPATATTQAAATIPAAPAGLIATAVSASQIDLSWTPSTGGNVNYAVYAGSTMIASGLGAANFSATGLAASTAYTFTVTASSTAGTSPASAAASAITLSAGSTAPGAPSGLSASTSSPTSISLSWQASSTANVTYNVYGAASGTGSTLLSSGLLTTNDVMNGLASSTTYNFTIVAVLNSVASAASNVATATTQALPATPPTNVAAAAVSTMEIDLTWTAVASAGITYSVYVGTQSGATNTLLISGLTGTSFAATSLTANTTYYFTLRGVSAAGTSSPSTQASATTLSGATLPTPTQPTTVAAPTNMTALAMSSSQINLSWSPSTTAGVTYTLYGNASTNASAVIASGLGATSYVVTDLTPATVYSYSVVAVTASGVSAASNGASATTQSATIPTAPTGLVATAISSSKINLSWTASTGSGISYNVYSGTASGAATTLLASGIGSASYSATGLTESKAYYFVVKAVSTLGASPASTEATATTQAASTATGCHVDYTVYSDWGTGLSAGINITNNSKTALTSWTLTWTFAGNQQLLESWNGTYTQTGKAVSIKSAGWNGAIDAGGTAPGVGFNASYTGTNAAPATFYLNGIACK